MTAAEKRLERLHILRTMRNAVIAMTAKDIASRANAECSVSEDHPDLGAIDALPPISPRGITAKLNAMSLDGLVVMWLGGNGWPNEWSLTDKGREAIAAADSRDEEDRP